LAGGSFGLAAVAAALITGLLLALYTRRKIGGYTGDTLGAVYEIASIMPALVAAAWGWGGMAT
ncbi:MAG: adenosylcobinamide-GDP ribazoletransferase, partial [Syntrophales bacterium]